MKPLETSLPWINALSEHDTTYLAQVVAENGNLAELDLLLKLSWHRHDMGEQPKANRQVIMVFARQQAKPNPQFLTDAEWNRFTLLKAQS